MTICNFLTAKVELSMKNFLDSSRDDLGAPNHSSVGSETEC
jgi:hypothetical protein